MHGIFLDNVMVKESEPCGIIDRSYVGWACEYVARLWAVGRARVLMLGTSKAGNCLFCCLLALFEENFQPQIIGRRYKAI